MATVMTRLREAGKDPEGEVFLVDKPKGWTSFDVVNKIRRSLRLRKVGHAGTLDPMATGLLIVCTGARVRDVDRFMGLEKEYDATMVLGARTESFDAETPVMERRATNAVTEEDVRTVLAQMIGPQIQVPPMWSAAKVGGRRLYKYARKGISVERRPREIVVHSLTPVAIGIPEVRFTVVCSKGTYVRALVDEIGNRLGCGAYLSALRRTRIGEYSVADASTIEELVAERVAGSGGGA